MKNELISVIVPVYRVEAFLNRCVDSILAQTYYNLEILLVDDGSPDNCGKMCDEYAQKNPRITALHKQNGGLSSARNYGIDHARGEYLAFVDSDDWIEPEMIETLYRAVCRNSVDMACCNIKVVGNHGLIRLWQNPIGKDVVMNQEELMKALASDRISTSSCNKLFHRTLFDGVRYMEGMLYEDLELMHRCLYHAAGGVYVDIPMYNYYMNNDGITKSSFTVRNFDFMVASNCRVSFYEQHRIPGLDETVLHHLGVCLNVLDRSVHRRELLQNRRVAREAIQSRLKQYPSIRKKLGKRERMKCMLLTVGLWLYDGVIGAYIAVRGYD